MSLAACAHVLLTTSRRPLTTRTALNRTFLQRALMILLLHLRQGTWGPLRLDTVDTQISIMDLGQGCSLEVGNPLVETWTKSCASRCGGSLCALIVSDPTDGIQLSSSAARRAITPTIVRTVTSRETGGVSTGRPGGLTIRIGPRNSGSLSVSTGRWFCQGWVK